MHASTLLSLFDTPVLRGGLGHPELALGAATLAILLALGAYLDLFRGRIVNNELTLPLIGLGLLAAPLLYQQPLRLVLPVIITTVVFGVLWLVGAQGGADMKLYIALALVFGSGVFAVVFLSCLVAVCYAMPWALIEWKLQGKPWREAHEKPFVPAIALAFPLALGIFGARPLEVLGLVLLQVIVVVALWFRYRGHSAAELRWGNRPQRCPAGYTLPDGRRFRCLGEDGHADGHTPTLLP